MDFRSFSNFIVNAPAMLEHLLAVVGVVPTIAGKVQLAFKEFTPKDFQCHYNNGHIATHRLQEIASAAGLDPNLALLPISLYEVYCTEEVQRLQARSLTQEEIHFYLTYGETPQEMACMLDGVIFTWNPRNAQLLDVLIDDDDIDECCVSYLQSTGRNFSSIDELVEYAKVHHWPHWNKIEIAFNKRGDGSDFLRCD